MEKEKQVDYYLYCIVGLLWLGWNKPFGHYHKPHDLIVFIYQFNRISLFHWECWHKIYYYLANLVNNKMIYENGQLVIWCQIRGLYNSS